MPPTPDHNPTPGTGRHPHGLDGDAAVDLLIANTGPGQAVLDLDDDPVLRAAAHATGRRYRTLTPHRQALTGRAILRADLVTLAWPRTDSPTPTDGHPELNLAAAALAPGGHVALLLEPTIAQPYTITWTGALLAAARTVGLDYLQDVVCLHTTPDTPDPTPDGAPRPAPASTHRHRVVLILRPQAGRHA